MHIYTANQDTDLNELFSNNMPEWSSVTSPSPPQSSSSLLSQIPDDLYAPAIKYAENSRIVQSLKKIIGNIYTSQEKINIKTKLILNKL